MSISVALVFSSPLIYVFVMVRCLINNCANEMLTPACDAGVNNFRTV